MIERPMPSRMTRSAPTVAFASVSGTRRRSKQGLPCPLPTTKSLAFLHKHYQTHALFVSGQYTPDNHTPCTSTCHIRDFQSVMLLTCLGLAGWGSTWTAQGLYFCQATPMGLVQSYLDLSCHQRRLCCCGSLTTHQAVTFDVLAPTA